MELSPGKITSLGFLLLYRIYFYCHIRVHNLIQTLATFASTNINTEQLPHNHQTCFDQNAINGDKLCSGELKMVMEGLGILCDHPVPDGDEFGAVEFSALFQVEPAGLEEVKEAFDVFDDNKDGFIDATELHRVLCSLGLQEAGSKVEECTRMISAFDENGDGLIDFNEFVMFMEKCFS